MLGEAPVMGLTGMGIVAVTVLVVRLMTETVQLPSGWAAVGAAQGRLGLPPWTPSPALATTISLRAGAKSAQSGDWPTVIGFVAPPGKMSGRLVWALIT